MIRLLPLLTVLASGSAFAAAGGPVSFKVQEVDHSLKIGYAVRIADVNADGKQDIIVCDAERVIWFSNPDWKLHLVVDCKAAGITTDNVCIAPHDIDGDGRLDLALGADWQVNNTKAGGSLQWLQQPAEPDKPWSVYKIKASDPTLHRINFADLDGDGHPELVVAPLKGVNATKEKDWADTPVHLTAYAIPADPKTGPWEPKLVTDQFHVMHNFLPVQWGLGKGEQLLTASHEGVYLLTSGAGGSYTAWKLGEGTKAAKGGSPGAGEIKAGHLKDGRMILATVEPMHGNQAVVYVQPAGTAVEPDKLWARTVLDETLTGGHAVGCADFNGDGNDEIVIGWRDVIAGKPPVGIRVFSTTGHDQAPTWQMTQIEKGEMACEDLACGDLNGDGRPDIVAVGRATRNVRIYWNQ